MKRSWNKRILHLSQSDKVIFVSYFQVICFRFLSEQTMPCSLTLTFEGLTSIFMETVTGQIAFMWTTSSKTCSDSKLRSFLLFLLLEKGNHAILISHAFWDYSDRCFSFLHGFVGSSTSVSLTCYCRRPRLL